MFSTRWSRVLANAALASLSFAYGLNGSAQPTPPTYQLLFEAKISAGQLLADASIGLTQPDSLLHELRFRAPAQQYSQFSGDGDIRREDDVLIWLPPPSGGKLQYRVSISHKRDGGGFDALITDEWAIFRGDDVFPAAHIRRAVGSVGRSELIVRAPESWSVVTPFASGPKNRYVINNPERIFDRPTGWMIAGKLGVRRDLIADINVSIAGPVGAGVQRTSMLALLRWTLPYLTRELDEFTNRLSIVSANDPMWRGGLSAPKSIFIHADRPLLSENATSTLLHEVAHVLMRFPTQPQHDWIDEGLAEYITLKILRRGGTISDKRFAATIDKFRDRAKTVNSVITQTADGAIKAKGVVIFYDLDREIQELTEDRADIFDLVRRLMLENIPVDLARLRELAAEISYKGQASDKKLKSLGPDRVPGSDK